MYHPTSFHIYRDMFCFFFDFWMFFKWFFGPTFSNHFLLDLQHPPSPPKALGAHVVAIDLPRPQIWQRLITTARASPGKLTLPLKDKARAKKPTAKTETKPTEELLDFFGRASFHRICLDWFFVEQETSLSLLLVLFSKKCILWAKQDCAFF